MSCVHLLKKLGLLPLFSRSEINEAEEEDVIRTVIEHKVASRKSLETAERFHESNEKLKQAVHNLRSSAFANFERTIRD